MELDFLLRFPFKAGVTSPVDFLQNQGWGGIKVGTQPGTGSPLPTPNGDVHQAHQPCHSVKLGAPGAGPQDTGCLPVRGDSTFLP